MGLGSKSPPSKCASLIKSVLTAFSIDPFKVPAATPTGMFQNHSGSQLKNKNALSRALEIAFPNRFVVRIIYSALFI